MLNNRVKKSFGEYMNETLLDSNKRIIMILKKLAAGPMRVVDIYKPCFVKPDGRLVSKRVFNRRMKWLEANRYIDIFEWKDRGCRNGIARLAILSERGADFLCLNSNVEKEHIRMFRPKLLHMRHELILANIIRFIWDHEHEKKYIISCLQDDREMKRTLKRKGISAKNLYLPDLIAQVKFATGEVQLYIELDCGSKTKSYWTKKISSWDRPTLLISLTRERSELMANYVCGTQQLRGIVFIVSLQDFYKGGGLDYFKNELLKPEHQVYLYTERKGSA